VVVNGWLPWLLLLPLLWLAGCDTADRPLAIGDRAPAVDVEQLQGGTIQLPAAYRGRVVLIHFWADWCARCREELQGSEPLYRRYRKRGLEVLAINLQQPRATVHSYLAGLDISYPVLLDSGGEMSHRYGVSALPVVYLLDRHGKLHTRMLGGASPDQLERLIRRLL
jgi:peroxiredoxin